MGKFKIGLQLDVKFLENLCKEKTSGVSIQKSRHHLVLHPIHLKNFSGSIKDLLNAGIAKFDKRLGGILLGYQNIKLLNDKGTIHDDSSGIHVDLEGDFFVFKPSVGKEMQGVVNRKGEDFLGVLVYQTFNVSIPKPQNEDKWLGQDIQIGNEVLFKIQHVDTSFHLPFIRGDLMSVISKSEESENVLQEEQLKMQTSSDNSPSKKVSVAMENSHSEGLKEMKLKKKKKRDKSEHPKQNDENISTKSSDTKKAKKRKLSEELEVNKSNDTFVKKNKKRRSQQVPP